METEYSESEYSLTIEYNNLCKSACHCFMEKINSLKDWMNLSVDKNMTKDNSYTIKWR